jgi:hypothetical protein
MFLSAGNGFRPQAFSNPDIAAKTREFPHRFGTLVAAHALLSSRATA